MALTEEDRKKIEQDFEDRLYYSSQELQMRDLLFVGKQQVGKSQAIKTLKDSFTSPGIPSMFAKTKDARVISFLLQRLESKEIVEYMYRCVDSCGLFEMNAKTVAAEEELAAEEKATEKEKNEEKDNNNKKEEGEEEEEEDATGGTGRTATALVRNLTNCLKKSIRKINVIFLTMNAKSSTIDLEDLKSLLIFLNLFKTDKGRGGVKKVLLLTHADELDDRQMIRYVAELKGHPVLEHVLSDNPLEYIVDVNDEGVKKKYEKELALLEKQEGKIIVEDEDEPFETHEQMTGDEDDLNDKLLLTQLISKAKNLDDVKLDILPLGAVTRHSCYTPDQYESKIQRNEERKEIILNYINNAEKSTKMDDFRIVHKEALSLMAKIDTAISYLKKLLHEETTDIELDTYAQGSIELFKDLSLNRGLMVLDCVRKSKEEFLDLIEKVKEAERFEEKDVSTYLHEFA